MKNIKFKECNVEIAKDQEEYNTLYAYMDSEVTVSCGSVKRTSVNLFNRSYQAFIKKPFFSRSYDGERH